MTPAEHPSETERNFLPVLLVKKAIRLPIPVESPAKSVKPKARQTLLSIRTMLSGIMISITGKYSLILVDNQRILYQGLFYIT
jgi:hypothetical protein